MTQTGFIETEEQQALRKAVAAMAANYGQDYYLEKARAGGHTDELWNEAGKLGFIGVNLPEEYGGGGAGMYELSLVLEELAAAGCPLLMMVVSPAICGTIIARFGTEEQKKRWLPGLADGSIRWPSASPSPTPGPTRHRITTTARRDGSDWILTGPEGVHLRRRPGGGACSSSAAPRTAQDRQRSSPRCSSCRPTPRASAATQDRHGLSACRTSSSGCSSTTSGCPPTRWSAPRTPRSRNCSPGSTRSGSWAPPARSGMGRFALDKAVDYAKTRQVWKTPIGAHQAIAHPLAQTHIEIELAKLMMQKAATLYDAGDDVGAGEAANMAKYAAGEASVRAVDQAVQTLGGNGLTKEYGLAAAVTASSWPASPR